MISAMFDHLSIQCTDLRAAASFYDVAFSAKTRQQVQDFFDAAVTHGAAVLHQPKVWPEYHDANFGAFVRDPDGNNIEAVCHSAE